MNRITLNVEPTGLSTEEEERIVEMLEAAAKESMRAIGGIETFILPRFSEERE